MRHAVEAAAPAETICIGRRVGDVLEPRLKAIGARVTVLRQPNARLSSEEHQSSLLAYYGVVQRAD